MKKGLFIILMLLGVSTCFAQKNVLIEELTGTWCQWCPGGIHYGDSLVKTYDNVIFVAVHCDDPMTNGEYVDASGMSTAPSANINRHYFGSSINNWFTNCIQEMQRDPLANVSINNNYNEETRTITSSVSVEALATLNSSYRIGAIVIEDAVSGPAPDYNQNNIYGGGSHGAMGGFENLPNPIPATRIAYDHVARQLLGGYDGLINSLPATLPAGSTATADFTYVIPKDYDPNYIRVIGVLITPEGAIDNSAISTYLDGSKNAAPKFTSTGYAEAHVGLNYLYNVYFHDTDDEEVIVSAVNIPEWLNLDQYDNRSAVLQGIPDEPGDYEITLQVSDGEKSTEQTYTINVSEPLDGNWEYVGNRAFSGVEFYIFSIRTDSEGNTYVFGNEDGMATVYKNAKDSESWEKLGNTQTTVSVTPSNMVVSSNDEIYIAFNDMNLTGHVMKWNGTSWQTVGNGFAGPETKVFLDNNDVPYLLFRDITQGYMGLIKRLENNMWVPVGNGGQYNEYGYWHELAFDSNNTPYVSYTSNIDGVVHVSKFENGSWQEVGTSIGLAYYYTKIAFDSNDNLYLANINYSSRCIDLFRYENNAWQLLIQNISASQTNKFNMAVNGTDIVLAYINQNDSDKLSVVKFDGETSEYVGATTCTNGQIDNPVVTFYNNIIEVAYTDADMENRASCMKYISNEILFPPTNLKAELIQNDWVKLTWEAPAQGEPDSYIVYRNDVKIATVAEFEFIDENLQPGTYHYTVTAKYSNGESTPAGPATVETTTSINEMSNGITLYPTMASSTVTINSKNNGVVEFYNCEGQKVMSAIISEGETKIDVSALTNGIYFIVSEAKTIKMIKY